jgi:hypothetical protein
MPSSQNQEPIPDSLRRQASELPSFDSGDAVAVAALVVLVLGFFWRVTFTHAMFFYRDVLDYSYPHARFIAEMLRRGQLPYWNPLMNFGEPVLANPNFLFFYPDTLLYVVLPVNLAYSLHYVLHFALAAVGTYLACRAWRLTRGAAFLAGVIFGFSGPMLSLGNFYNQVACAAWIPWTLLAVHFAVTRRSRRAWTCLAVIFALQFLASEPLTLFASYALCLAYALIQVIGEAKSHRIQAAAGVVGRLILVGLLMLGIAAVQLLPAMELLKFSRRGAGAISFGETVTWSFHPLSLLAMVIPDYFAQPFVDANAWSTLLNSWNKAYYVSVFVGFVPFYLALAGWAFRKGWREHFAAASFLSLLLLAFGKYTPLFQWVYWVFPPLHLLRFPCKWIVPALLMLAMLAGMGFDALREYSREANRRMKQFLIPLGCLGLIFIALWITSWIDPPILAGLAGWLLSGKDGVFAAAPTQGPDLRAWDNATTSFIASARVFIPGFVGFILGGFLLGLALARGKAWTRKALPVVAGLAALQLFLVNYDANPTVPAEFYAYTPPAVAEMPGTQTEGYRFCYIFGENAARSGAGAAPLDFSNLPAASELEGPAVESFRDRLVMARGSMLTGASGIFNHDVEDTFPPYMEQFWIYALRTLRDASRRDILLGRANVKYYFSHQPQIQATLREAAQIFDGSPGVEFLYENLQAMPRAYATNSSIVSQSPEQILDELSAPDFNAHNSVILGPGESLPRQAAGQGTPGDVEIRDHDPNLVTLRAHMAGPGFVVLLDRFDPNWRATVDGVETPIYRANLLFRAVAVGAGQHEVRFIYHQRGLIPGAIVSVAAILAGMLGFLYPPRARA